MHRRILSIFILLWLLAAVSAEKVDVYIKNQDGGVVDQIVEIELSDVYGNSLRDSKDSDKEVISFDVSHPGSFTVRGVTSHTFTDT